MIEKTLMPPAFGVQKYRYRGVFYSIAPFFICSSFYLTISGGILILPNACLPSGRECPMINFARVNGSSWAFYLNIF
jgi:hypothetical protein